MPLEDRRSMNQLVQMWKHWMAKWNSRRRTILVQRRSNIEGLVSQFVTTNRSNQQALFEQGGGVAFGSSSSYNSNSYNNRNRFSRADEPLNNNSHTDLFGSRRHAEIIRFPGSKMYPPPTLQVSSYGAATSNNNNIQNNNTNNNNNNNNVSARELSQLRMQRMMMAESKIVNPKYFSHSSSSASAGHNIRHGYSHLRGFEMGSFIISSQHQQSDQQQQQQLALTPQKPSHARSSRHFDRVQLPGDHTTTTSSVGGRITAAISPSRYRSETPGLSDAQDQLSQVRQQQQQKKPEQQKQKQENNNTDAKQQQQHEEPKE